MVNHTVDDNVSMSSSSSNSSSTTKIYNFGTNNIVVIVFNQKIWIERLNFLNLFFNSDIDNNGNDNDTYSVTSVSSSSTFSSAKISEPL